MKLDKHVVDMFTELTKPADDVKMEKTCYGTISVVDGTRYVKLDGSDLLVPAASTVKTSHGDRVTVLMKNHSLTVTGNLTAPATDGEGGSPGETGTAATIEVGTVTTGEAGSSASVTNSGTTSAAVFDFVIPRGDKGEKGDPGPQGPQGEKGDTGTWDGTIPDHQHAVSDITDFPTSLPANGGNADTVDGKHASDFFNNIADFITPESSGKNTLLEYISSINSSTSNFYISNFDDLPTNNWGYNVTVYKAGGAIYVIAYRALSNHEIYVRDLNFSGEWNGDWTRLNDGGNADTVDGFHANEIASNPNLLINPDFKINQRGQSEYTSSITSGTEKIYTVDRWFAWLSSERSVTVDDNGLTCVGCSFRQTIDMPISELIGKKVTLSIGCDIIDATSGIAAIYCGSAGNIAQTTINKTGETTIVISGVVPETATIVEVLMFAAKYRPIWAKLELGSIATPFCPPDPATELAKCQRYYQRYYANEMPNALRVRDSLYSIQMNIPNMRATPAVRYHWRFGSYDNILEDGNDAPHTAVFTTSAYTNYRTVRIVINTDASTPTGYLPADENSYCELESEI